SDVFNPIRFADPGRPDQNYVLLDVLDLLRASGVFFLEPAQVIGVVIMIANSNRQDLLRFILLDYETIKMRLDVSRQEIELEFVMIGLFRFFIVFCRRGFRLGYRRDRDPIAEVLIHELCDRGLQLFRRRKGWWRAWC